MPRATLTLVLATLACASTGARVATHSVTPAWATDFLKRWYASYNASDASGLAHLFASDARFGSITGRTAIGFTRVARLLGRSGALRMVLGLRTVIYPTPDLAAAKRWYTDMLGVSPYFDEPFYVGFSVGGFELGLLPDATPGTVGPQPLWGVADIGLACSRLIELGASPLEPITEVGGGIKVAAVVDPFGNRFGVIENPHFSASAVR